MGHRPAVPGQERQSLTYEDKAVANRIDVGHRPQIADGRRTHFRPGEGRNVRQSLRVLKDLESVRIHVEQTPLATDLHQRTGKNDPFYAVFL